MCVNSVIVILRYSLVVRPPGANAQGVAALPYVVVNNQTAMTTQLARQIKRALVVDTNPTAFAKHLSEDKGEALTTLQV